MVNVNHVNDLLYWCVLNYMLLSCSNKVALTEWWRNYSIINNESNLMYILIIDISAPGSDCTNCQQHHLTCRTSNDEDNRLCSVMGSHGRWSVSGQMFLQKYILSKVQIIQICAGVSNWETSQHCWHNVKMLWWYTQHT